MTTIRKKDYDKDGTLRGKTRIVSAKKLYERQ
jgi:hypothetical protein